MAIIHQIRPRYETRNDEIVGELIQSAGAVSASDPTVVIKRTAAEIAYLMALVHGGDWRVQIDHEAGFVQIARRLQCNPQRAAK